MKFPSAKCGGFGGGTLLAPEIPPTTKQQLITKRTSNLTTYQTHFRSIAFDILLFPLRFVEEIGEN